MTSQIQNTIHTLFQPGSVLELRALWKNGGVASGYYTDYEKMAQDAAILDGLSDIAGIYVVANEINPDLFARRANRLNMKLSRDDKTTGDEDIIHRNWFLIDVDPRRPSGISSTDAEHQAALHKADRIREFLSELGWPEPVCADSGNGAHLMYRIDLPNDDASQRLIKSALLVLSAFFSDEQSDVDTTVSNAARIWKLYGTLSRKGDSTDYRPHRRSLIRSRPDVLEITTYDLFLRLVSLLPTGEDIRTGIEKQGIIPREEGFSLGTWLQKNGFSCREKPYGGGILYLFDQCPFSSAHADGAYAIQFANGGIFAGCHHNSCGGGTQRWQELRERIEGKRPHRDYDTWRREGIRKRARDKAERDGIPELPGAEEWKPASEDTNITLSESAISPDTPSQTSHPRPEVSIPLENRPEIWEKAMEILHQGNPIQYILDTFAEHHVGDGIVARCLIMSLASRLVENSKGLHVLVTGESGKGKSHSFDTMLDLIPEEDTLAGRFSDKALFYLDDLKKGSVICLDDVSLSEPMQETLKGVTSSFHKPFIYRTVDKERKGLVRIIPQRCVWWVAKMEGTGDDQVWNRMLTVWIDDSIEQDTEVMARELAAAARSTALHPEISERTFICRALWKELREYPVLIPYAERIRFASVRNRRNLTMLLDLIRSVALMYQYQREIQETNGVKEVIASEEDFTLAKEIFLLISGAHGGQYTKLTKAEYEMVEIIRREHIVSFTLQEMQKLLGKSRTATYRIIHPKDPNKREYEGLLEKCPPLSFTKQSLLLESGKRQICNVYTWDYEMDAIWSGRDGCWLSSDDDDDQSDEMNRSPVQVCPPVPMVFSENDTEIKTRDAEFYLNTEQSGSEKDGVHTPAGSQSPDVSDHTGSCEFKNNAHRTQSLGNTNNSSPDSETVPDVPVQKNENRVGSGCAQDHSVQESDTDTDTDTVTKTRDRFLSKSEIDPARCIRIEGTGAHTRVCDSCGATGGIYELRAGIRMPVTNAVPIICEKCHSAAVAREVLSFRALPGLLPIANMKPFDKEGVPCSLCHINRIAWLDDETNIGLCQTCYEREKDLSARERDTRGTIEERSDAI